MYGETNLGATDEAMLTFFKTPMNKPIFDALKRHVYPEFAIQFATQDATASPLNETAIEEPEVNPSTKKKSSK